MRRGSTYRGAVRRRRARSGPVHYAATTFGFFVAMVAPVWGVPGNPDSSRGEGLDVESAAPLMAVTMWLALVVCVVAEPRRPGSQVAHDGASGGLLVGLAGWWVWMVSLYLSRDPWAIPGASGWTIAILCALCGFIPLSGVTLWRDLRVRRRRPVGRR